jgi:hypothetical protein
MFRNVTCACRRSDDEDHEVARDNLFQAVVCVPSTLGGAAGGGGNGEEERYRRGGKEEIGRGGKEVIQAD